MRRLLLAVLGLTTSCGALVELDKYTGEGSTVPTVDGGADSSPTNDARPPNDGPSSIDVDVPKNDAGVPTFCDAVLFVVPFDDTSGRSDTSIAPSVGGVFAASLSGKFGGSAELSNGAAALTYSFSSSRWKEGAVSLWVLDATGTGEAWDTGCVSAQRQLVLVGPTGGPALVCENGQVVLSEDGSPLATHSIGTGGSTSDWHHVVMSWSASGSMLKFDGAIAPGAGASQQDVASLQIGGNPLVSAYVDDVALFKRALTATEASAIAAANAPIRAVCKRP